MFYYKVFLSSLLYGLVMLEGNQAKIITKRGVMDNLNDGLKVAGQMLGINTAADVANLVAKAFSANTNNNRNKPDLISSLLQNAIQNSPTHSISSEDNKNGGGHSETVDHTKSAPASVSTSKEMLGGNFGTSNFIVSMLRMVGFDATKLGALAINALIMIASAIGNTIIGTTKPRPVVTVADGARGSNRNPKPTPTSGEYVDDNEETGPEEKYAPNDHQPRTVKDPTTIDWFLQNPSKKMKRILKEATNTNLADKLTEMITNYETAQGQGSCLKMLVCKSSPFIWGMQKSIRKHIEPQENTEGDAKSADDENLSDGDSKRLFTTDHFFTHLPSIKEYREYGEKCEKLYATYCNTSDLYKKNL